MGRISKWKYFQSGKTFKVGELSEKQIAIQRKRFEVGGLSKWEDFQSGRIFREAANNSKVRGGRAFKVGGLSKWENFQRSK